MLIIKDCILLKNLTDRRGRTYNKNDVIAELKSEYIGEILTDFLPENFTIDLSKASHKVTNIRFCDNDVVGDVSILDSPQGMIIKSLIETGIEFETSIRASGIVSENFKVSDLKIYSFDLMITNR
jgi:hypothetical protein